MFGIVELPLADSPLLLKVTSRPDIEEPTLVAFKQIKAVFGKAQPTWIIFYIWKKIKRRKELAGNTHPVSEDLESI